MRAVESVVPEIKRKYDLKVCASLGLLTPELARRLKDCGVDRVNHNVNTSPEHHARICTTHSFQERLDTLRAVRAAGLELCSGGIIGMGENDEDVVNMAMVLRDLDVDSIPINFFHPVEGTPLAHVERLNPRYCLKSLALFRFVHPARDIRIAGGRELHLGSMQCLGLYAANSIFVGDYLTTKGQPCSADHRMIEEMGFVVREPP
jgi:biotin synthase